MNPGRAFATNATDGCCVLDWLFTNVAYGICAGVNIPSATNSSYRDFVRKATCE